MRQSTFTNQVNETVLADVNAGDWAKQQSLRNIEMVREIKKR